MTFYLCILERYFLAQDQIKIPFIFFWFFYGFYIRIFNLSVFIGLGGVGKEQILFSFLSATTCPQTIEKLLPISN